jgi:acyl-ACP thioesterase
MSTWPKWNDRIRVETWVRPSEGAFAVRDFFVFDEQGRLIGEATTSWVRLAFDTHKPIREPLTDFPAGTGRCSFDAEKIPVRTPEVTPGLTTLARFEVRNSDIDGNQHVNNTRYSQWVLDAIPIASHSQYVLDEYSVNFLSETRLGDAVEIQSSPDEGYYHGLRLSDQKIVFTVQLKARPKLESGSDSR